MKHKHYEMIKAVADNTSLITFCKGNSGRWKVACPADIFYNDSFLCLPQHNESGQCLHWLNGGDVQYKLQNESKWIKVAPYLEMPKWRKEGFFNSPKDYVYRIKPKKEKRWIATNGGWNASSKVFPSKQNAVDLLGVEGYQFHEIEVEV